MSNKPEQLKVMYVDEEDEPFLKSGSKRPFTTFRIVDEYFRQGPTIQHAKLKSFEALVVLLKDKAVVTVSKACLQRLHLLSLSLHGSPTKASVPQNVNVRIFLAAFMIACRPTHVFESMGALEQALLEAAIPLLETFEKIGRAILTSEKRCFSDIPKELTKDFPAMFFEYLKRFKAWKVPDEAKLTCRIKHALVALYQAQKHLPPYEPEDSKLKMEIISQIERLRTKLQQIAGAGALAHFDEQHKIEHPAKSDESSIEGGSGGQIRAVAEAGSRCLDGGAYVALPGRMTNEQLAHELLLDPTFQLDENGGCSSQNPIFHRIRESFHQAFWDSLVDDLKIASPCYVRLLRVLAEIRDGISDLAGSSNSTNIMDTIDLDFITQQAEKGFYGWQDCVRLITAIVETIEAVQAPKRRDETKLKWKQVTKGIEEADASEQPRAFCRALEFLLDRVNIMRIDAANERLRLVAPVIKDHGIEYERGKLQNKLNDGSLTLERTQECIARTVKREVAVGNVELQNLVEGKTTAFLHIHSSGMLSLIADGEVPRVQNCPETLLFDVHRLSLLQAEYQYLVLAATMLVTVGHNLKATSNATDAQVLGVISEQLISESRQGINVEQVVSEVSQSLARATIFEDSKEKIKRVLVQCAAPTDAVHQLMRTRIRTLFGQILQEGTVSADVQLISAAKPLVPRILKAALKLRNVTVLNRNVHAPHYDRIILEEAQKLKSLFLAK